VAFSNSGLYIVTVQEQMKGTTVTGGPINPATATGWKIALHSNTLTQGTAPINYSAASPNWANTNEVFGTGWAAGGVLLTAAATGAASTVPILAEGTTGSLRYDMNDISVAGTSLNLARGCIIYFDAATAPAALVDAMFIAVTFGTDATTANGTFGIQWATTGVAELDLTP
jgi:hypothetical protein